VNNPSHGIDTHGWYGTDSCFPLSIAALGEIGKRTPLTFVALRLRRLIGASSAYVPKPFLHFPKQEYKKHWDRRLQNHDKQW